MFVVTLPSQAAEDPLAFASKAKAAGADLLEIRGDITPLVSTFDSPLPLIISPRRKGNALLRALQPAYVDLEPGEEAAIPSGTRVIRSFHEHTGTPTANDLRSIITRLLKLNPDIVKIAATISRYADIERLSELRNLLPKDRRVILGMGPKAHTSRMLSPFQMHSRTRTSMASRVPPVRCRSFSIGKRAIVGRLACSAS